MTNKVINAVIALVENRPQDAKEMLRSPEMRISASELQLRLDTALRKREERAIEKELKTILRHSLRLDISKLENEEHETLSPKEVDAYVRGVAYVESILEDFLAART